MEIDLSSPDEALAKSGSDNDSGNTFGLDLGAYSEPKEVVNQPLEIEVNTNPQPIPPVNNETPPNPEQWRGDNRYYQSGKKAGQLRPEPKVRASYNHNSSTTMPATMLINGALFLTVINFIIPLIIVTVNNWLSPKEKMTVKDLQLTKDEKKEVDPLMDATLKQLNIQANPLILLCITLISSYAMKFVQKKLDFPEPETDNK